MSARRFRGRSNLGFPGETAAHLGVKPGVAQTDPICFAEARKNIEILSRFKEGSKEAP